MKFDVAFPSGHGDTACQTLAIRTALDGISGRQATVPHGVGVSTVTLWLRRVQPGKVSAQR
jgi:transposase